MNTIFKTGEFVDFKGDKHFYTIAGVVESYSDDLSLEKIVDTEIAYNEDGSVMFDNDDNLMFIDTTEEYAPIYKVISIGISICNPCDSYNEFRGKKQAEGRALKYHDRVIALSKGGMCTPETVQFFVDMTASNLESNPGLFIKGYNEAARKYSK